MEIKRNICINKYSRNVYANHTALIYAPNVSSDHFIIGRSKVHLALVLVVILESGILDMGMSE